MQTIILLHGALGTSKDLERLSGELKHSGCRVFRLSFSGHEKNGFRDDFGIEQFSSELESFIRHHQLVKPCVFGYSMGGYVALYLAMKKKDLLNKIITLGTKFNWSEETVAKETKMLEADVIIKKVPAFAQTLEEKHGSSWKELLLATAEMMKKIGKTNALTPITLPQIDIPVLVGVADKDHMVSLEETTSAFKALPRASMYMLPGTKHSIETVNVSLLGKLILDFITDAPAQK